MEASIEPLHVPPSTPLRSLPVHEIFHTFQGEGCHMGRAAFFVRLYGCPLHCSFCDSAGTWHKDFVPSPIQRMSAQAIIDAAKESGASFVVITGGEPAIHDLRELTVGLRLAGLGIHIETSGAFPLRGFFDWVTVSPKFQKLPLRDNLMMAQELKIIVTNDSDIDVWAEELGALLQRSFAAYADCQLKGRVWLHPEWSQRDNPAVLRYITDKVKAQPLVYRAGYQTHKLYRADALDKRSAPLVPLGGDIDKGY